MTQPTDGSASGAPADAQGGTANGGSDGTTGSTDSTQSATGTESSSTDTQGGVTREEFEALRTRMQAADRAKSAAEEQLRQLRDKDLPEAEKMKRDNEVLTGKVKQLEEQNRSLAIGNAFLADNTHDWHDPRAALNLLDRSRITVNEDGTVEGMKTALKALADANPWMIKPKTDSAGAAAPPAVGVPPVNGGRTGSPTQTSTSQMKERFPALRSRLGG